MKHAVCLIAVWCATVSNLAAAQFTSRINERLEEVAPASSAAGRFDFVSAVPPSAYRSCHACDIYSGPDSLEKADTVPSRARRMLTYAAIGFVIGAVIGAAEESGHHTNCGQEVNCRAGIPYMAAAGGVAGALIGLAVGAVLPSHSQHALNSRSKTPRTVWLILGVPR